MSEQAQPTTPTEPTVPTTPEVPEVAAPLDLTKPATPEPPAVPGPEEDVTVTYEPTGDSGLDVALAYVGGLGFGPTHPGIVAAHEGNFGPLEEALKGLGDKAKGYAPYLAAAKDAHTRATARNQGVLDAVVAEVGGITNWNTIRAWASANADEGEKKEINAAFAAGKITATLMAARLAEAYKNSGQSNLAPASGLSGTAGKGGPSTTPLSPEEFKQEIAKLSAKHGSRAGNTPEYKQLIARRLAYQGK